MQLRTLGDLKKDNKDEKKNTTSYSGGESSGMAVENHPTVNKLMEKAALNTKTPEEHEVDKKKGDKTVCTITMYKNGYQVENEDFVDYNTEVGKAFMAELDKGYVPKSLQGKYKGGLTVSLNDKRGEDYVPPPPPPYVAFSGQSHSLGSSQPSVNTKPDMSQAFPINNSKPKTSINIRYHNGDKQTIQVNLETKVAEIFNYVSRVSKVSKFQLVSGFPPAPLDNNFTVEQAGLEGSNVIQRV